MADTGRRAPPSHQNTLQNDPSDSDSTELRMRRALGLGTGGGHATPQQRPEQARARHRFVQDGGVPVVMLGQKPEPETAALRERIATLEAQLDNERAAHATTRRTLEAEHHTVTALQTRIAHNDLTHKDALDQERRRCEYAQQALKDALANPGRRRAAPEPAPAHPESTAPARGEMALAHPARPNVASDGFASNGFASNGFASNGFASTDFASDDAPPSLDAAAATPIPVKRGRGRPRSAVPPEPKPVRWWTPSYRAKKP